MKKSEMKDHRDRYDAFMSEAKAAERSGRYGDAITAAVSAWNHIDGMMQYERKYADREFKCVSAIELVLEYAPLLLDHGSLDKLEQLLKDRRRIERDTADDLGGKLEKARTRMWDCYRLWCQLENDNHTRQDQLRRVLGGDQDVWRSVAEAWERMGVLRRHPEGGSYRLFLYTRMDERVRAKCPACGAIARAAKARLLEPATCPRCRTDTLFVILASEESGPTKG